jgi:beta-glucosidase
MARDIVALVGQMTLDEKASLTAGADGWHTTAIERLGIRSVAMTDGPNGARGTELPGVGQTLPAVCVPCGAMLGATWDVELVRRVGALLGREAREKAARILLAPTVNLQRSPLFGRHFECYSEDPLLTGSLAAAYIDGVQSAGVATTVKHFVGNESEFERFTADSQIDERTLRELYLVPFELAVRQGRTRGVMTSYNRLNGKHLANDEGMVAGVLRSEWGFDGFVVSDWYAIGDTEAAARAGLDLQMPGPSRFYGTALADAVRAGTVPEEQVDAAAIRLLSVLDRIGALDDPLDETATFTDTEEDRALARESAAAGMVLLANNGVLPLDPTQLTNVVVIGPNASRAVIMGGGSAQLQAPYFVSPMAAIEKALAGQATVTFQQGVDITRTVPPVPAEWVVGPDGEPGFAIDVYAGRALEGEVRRTTSRPDGVLMFNAAPKEVAGDEFSFRATGIIRPPHSGTFTLAMIQIGRARVFVDGVLVFDGVTAPPPAGIDTFGMGSVQLRAPVELDAGRGTEIVVEYSNEAASILSGVKIGVQAALPADGITLAATAANHADIAIVVVGTDGEWESEGHDRDAMELPGTQNELVAAVAAANPRTIVAVNAAAPVRMPWSADVAAIVHVSFGGQEMANALADVLFGAAEPGGRLPTTLPVRVEHGPSFGNFPAVNGATRYAEGVFVGYRWYGSRQLPVGFPFGHGLSYTTFRIDPPVVAPTFTPGESMTVDVTVTNTGGRRGCEVVQCYVGPPASQHGFRPERELKAFAKVWLDPGESTVVQLALDDRSFAYWNVPDPDREEMRSALLRGLPWVPPDPHEPHPHGWVVGPGDYRILVGRSVADTPHVATVRVIER